MQLLSDSIKGAVKEAIYYSNHILLIIILSKKITEEKTQKDNHVHATSASSCFDGSGSVS